MWWKSGSSELDTLKRCWSRWTESVELFALRRPSRRRVDPREYGSLRRELIAACQSLAEADASKRTYYESLGEMVQPWLSPRVLSRTDREILGHLLGRCREVEEELNGKPGWRWRMPRGAVRYATMALAGAVVLTIAWIWPGSSGLLETLRDAVDTVWFQIKFASDWEKLAVVAVILVVVSIYTASRTAKA